ncbi:MULTISPECIES: response regulator transcription factor [unclassified Pseudonocardia]|uniref:response regulator transcription factor n=1 Tax=unclassified Pseudonocardia TaxID=2619320 RepID=UPI00095D4FB4|nr:MULTISPECIES: response regulator transcription factor [unclassified Pseudonocardia]MBN9099883.1 response regulator transcription factor [Pseudonocardia sp.]OJY43913.1 MAG: DNA-binding response regulator [Pseudonocardia sp. 73-21]
MTRLLIVEDDDMIGGALAESLRANGHDVVWARAGAQALDEGGSFDLVLLDLGLPDLDGVEVCRRLRLAQPGTVIVILTARSEEMDVVVGLEAGADDYLVKPVRLAELHARLRAHLRRGAPTAPERSLIGDLVVDSASRRVTVAGREVVLRSKEFDLLARLAAEPGKAVGRETLMADVWDEHWFGSTKTLDVHIATLRRRLREHADAGTIPEITTLRGHGYRLEAGPEIRSQP